MISVVITCYNEGAYIEQAIDSVLRQTAAGQIREIVIIDDGSRPETLAVLRRLPARDGRIRVVEQANAGLPAARNAGIALCGGDWIALLDADDYWLEDKIERQLQAAALEPAAALIYTDYYTIDERATDDSRREFVSCRRYDRHTPDALAQFFVHDAPIIPSTVIIRRDVLAAVGGFDPSFKIGEDQELWLRILMLHSIAHVPAATLVKRVRSGSLGASAFVRYPHFERITRLFIERVPALKAVEAARTSRRLAKAGQQLADDGRRWDALKFQLRAIGRDPRYGRAYGNLAALALPSSWRVALTGMVRRALNLLRRKRQAADGR